VNRHHMPYHGAMVKQDRRNLDQKKNKNFVSPTVTRKWSEGLPTGLNLNHGEKELCANRGCRIRVLSLRDGRSRPPKSDGGHPDIGGPRKGSIMGRGG